MKYLHPVAFIPNELITDSRLHFTTRRVAAVLLHLAGRADKIVKVSFSQLSRLAHCSPVTAQKAVRELVQTGYLEKQHSYSYNWELHLRLLDANCYRWLKRKGGYTMIPRELLSYPLNAAAYCVLLFLYRCSGTSGRAFPSLRRLAGKLKAGVIGENMGMAKSTVCAALKALRQCQAIVRHLCRTRKGCYAANSYYMTDLVRPGCRKISFPEGGPIFNKLYIINQITRDYTVREKNIYSTLKVYSGKRVWVEDYWFDGTGVRVFSDGELAFTA